MCDILVMGARLGESSGKITGTRVLTSEGAVKVEVSFQGRGNMLGEEVS